MPGFMFMHMQTHARTKSKKASADAARSVGDVLAELERKPGHIPHVPNPTFPRKLFGMTVEQMTEAIEEGCEKARPDHAGKKVRKDQKVLMSIVVSHPYTPEEVKTDPAKAAEYEKWRRDSIRWARDFCAENGARLVSAWEHDDEGHMHLHLYALPEKQKGYRADMAHPGKRAKAEALAAGKTSKEANQAYKAAMTDAQDDYHLKAGAPNGLVRLGPRKRRLPAGQYALEKRYAASMAKTIQKTLAMDNAATARLQAANEARAEAERMKAEAERVKAENNAKSQEIAKRAKALDTKEIDISDREKAVAEKDVKVMTASTMAAQHGEFLKGAGKRLNERERAVMKEAETVEAKAKAIEGAVAILGEVEAFNSVQKAQKDSYQGRLNKGLRDYRSAGQDNANSGPPAPALRPR